MKKIIPARKNKIRKHIWLFLLAGMISPIVASDQIPAPKQKNPIALIGGVIHTVSGADIEDGTLLFENGKITALGKNVALPESTQRINIPDLHVYPGLISANTLIGLTEINAVRATLDFTETGTLNPNVRAEVAFNPDSEILPVTRANGVTMALSVPTGGLISGTSALMMLDGWTWEEMTLKAPLGLHISWPDMKIAKDKEDPKSEEKQKKKLAEQLKQLREIFSEARAYHKAKKSEGQKDIPYHDTDPRLESLIPVIEKEIPVFVKADEIRQIQAAVDWATEENIKMVLVGGYDSWRVTDLLKEKNIPVIITETHRLPERRWEAYDAPFTLPNKLFEAGIKFCISGSGTKMGTTNERNLPYQAGTAAAHGLPKTEALKSVTLYAAEILGVSDRVGSLEVGKDATLIVTTGDPLEVMSNVKMEFIQGRQIDLSSRHTELYQKYLTKYKQLGIIKE
jgi:imidazolonepropionase-like amidohydrolase